MIPARNLLILRQSGRQHTPRGAKANGESDTSTCPLHTPRQHTLELVTHTAVGVNVSALVRGHTHSQYKVLQALYILVAKYGLCGSTFSSDAKKMRMSSSSTRPPDELRHIHGSQLLGCPAQQLVAAS